MCKFTLALPTGWVFDHADPDDGENPCSVTLRQIWPATSRGYEILDSAGEIVIEATDTGEEEGGLYEARLNHEKDMIEPDTDSIAWWLALDTGELRVVLDAAHRFYEHRRPALVVEPAEPQVVPPLPSIASHRPEADPIEVVPTPAPDTFAPGLQDGWHGLASP